ncbi:MAG: glutathione S-transferase family protein [Beijerinckiaceae bacterium]
MDIVLYYAPNTCALVPFVALNEAGAAFRVEALNFRRKQQMSEDYLRLNPRHKVPLLLVDGKGLTENPAIHVWIARSFPQAGLMPDDPWMFAQAISVASWCASGIHPYLSAINTPSKVCDAAGSEESVKRLARAALDENFAVADRKLAGREFLFDRFSTADAHLFWCLRRAGQLGYDFSGFAHCNAFFERIAARPSVQKVFAFEKETLARFAA